MQTLADASTVDMTRTRLRLCSGVTFTPQVYGDQTFYHIEVGAKSLYYRIGYTEYVFLSLLDGRTSFCEALALTARTLGADALPQPQAMSLYTWAVENKVATFAEGDASKSTPDKPAATNPLQKYNPLWIRIPLGRPDAMLQVLQPFLGWLFSPVATVLGVLLMLAAMFRLATDWDRFAAASENVFAKENWLWLLLAWIGLKSVHELGHGLVCRRYGGTVRETGIILAFFAPLAYVDVTSCWAFRSRWQRIHTAVAGMYVELLLASIAIFTWTQFRSEVTSHLLYNVIVMASVSTLLFNANPLMRFDGYYILADLLQVPNLYTESGLAVKRFMSRVLFGIRSSTPTVGGGHGGILTVYGVAAFVWRIFICFTMALAASALFHGAGMMLSIMAAVAWFAMPVVKSVKGALQIFHSEPARAVRGAVIATAMAGLIVTVFCKMPVPFSNTAPGVVTLPDGRMIRSEVSGFIDRNHVVDGQRVEEGELLILLRNEDITSEYQDLRLEHQQETVRYQTALKEHDAGTAKVARGNLASLDERLAEAAQQAAALEIRAAAAGIVVARQLEARLNSYIKEGEELLLVDDDQPRELRVSVAQQDFAELESKLGHTVPVRLGTRARTTGIVTRVVPRASRRLPFQSLAATEGGSLPVVSANGDDGETESRLTEQRFEAVIQLRGEDATTEHVVGERGYISLPSMHRSLGSHAYYGFRNWLHNQIAATTRAARG